VPAGLLARLPETGCLAAALSEAGFNLTVARSLGVLECPPPAAAASVRAGSLMGWTGVFESCAVDEGGPDLIEAGREGVGEVFVD